MVDALWRTAAGDRGTRRLADLKHGRLKMPCDLGELLQRQFYFFGTYFVEAHILSCWEKEATGAKVVFDVGANAGIYSLAALAIRPDAAVHAFEPTPEIATRLRETAALNGLAGLQVHEAAVSSECGSAVLTRCRGELGTNEGMNFITSAEGDAAGEVVPTVSLDRFCSDRAIDRIDLLKLDIQGHEHRALAGAAHLLQEGRIGTIFTELNWDTDAAGTCPAAETIRILESAGYRFSEPGADLRWQASGSWMRPLSDVMARRAPSA